MLLQLMVLKKKLLNSKYREDVHYPLYFKDDYDLSVDVFNKFGINNIVTHNANFNLKFLLNKIRSKIKTREYSVFYTMQQNRTIIPNNKAQLLSKACKIYEIDFNESDAHGSDYDTLKVYELFVETMMKRA